MTKLSKLLEEKATLNLTLKVGDVIKFGKFKNKTATIEGFTTDEHNQPVAITDKGNVKIFHFRLEKLMDKGE